MKITPLAPFTDALLIEPRVFGDARGFFLESFNQQSLLASSHPELGQLAFVQDNHSRSNKGVLRGLHFQRAPHAQGKLVRVARGRVFDVALDVRPDSPTFGQWAGAILDDQTHHQLYLPPGYAHGFLVLEDNTDFLYKTTDYYSPADEGAVAWDDPTLGIDWPLDDYGIAEPVVSAKDAAAPTFADLRSALSAQASTRA